MKKNDNATARSLAIACLATWSGSGKPVQSYLDVMIHDSILSNEDRQLAVMLVMGVLRRQEYLDLLISRCATTALPKMKPLTLAALRIGVLQIYFLERVPDSAAVNETVAALKKMRQPSWLLGFVNATLRTLAREKASLSFAELAETVEHPVWLTERWRRNFGEEQMREICRINKIEPELCLHVNTSRTSHEQLAQFFAEQGINVRSGRYAPDSLIVPDWRGAVTALPGFTEGLFRVQDQAAQLACHLLGPFHEQGRYMDGCAGLGGKTCALAALMPAGASLQTVEPDNRRVRLLRENLEREGAADRVDIFHGTLEAFAATQPSLFDGILIDAPCSGTGVIRRHPDIRWNRQPDDFTALQNTQLALLDTAAALLTSGGVLVYATCSLEPEENQQVVEQFLTTHSAFSLSNCLYFLPEAAASTVDAQGFFAPLPTEEIEGFFAARMVLIGN
ncbi:16S rRNA (cytosine(967)-C(5))-methyltransferase RsmB [Desulfobulbus sp. F5]|nr:16S rRNA (cytosine(967)-C(5))-methyltransferase RsmB [Desulfobulbus sp. F5]